MNNLENFTEILLRDSLQNNPNSISLPSNASLIERARNAHRHRRHRRIGALSACAVALATAAVVLPNQQSSVIAQKDAHIGIYTAFAQTLPNYGSYSQSAGTRQIVVDFAREVLGVSVIADLDDRSINAITDTYVIRSEAGGSPVGWIALTDFSRDVRTAAEPVQQPFIIGMTGSSSADGHLGTLSDLIYTPNLYQAQKDSGYRVGVPNWKGCAEADASLRTWNVDGSTVINSAKVQPGEAAFLGYQTNEPIAAFAVARCFNKENELVHAAAIPVGLIPLGTVPASVQAASQGDVVFSLENNTDDLRTAGATQLFARNFHGEVRAFGKTLFATLAAGRGLPSPAARCEILQKQIPGSTPMRSLSPKYSCGVIDSDGSHYLIIEVRPGAVLLLTDSAVDSHNTFSDTELNEVAESITIRIND